MNKRKFTGCVMPKALVQSSLMALMLGLSSGATSAVIDNFDTQQGPISDSPFESGIGISSIGGGVDPNMIGGSRDISIEVVTGYSAQIGVFNSQASINIGSNATATAIYQWDGADATIALDRTGLQQQGVGVDLTESGAKDSFSIDVFSADHDYTFVFGVYTDDTAWTEITYAEQLTNGEVNTYEFMDFTDLCGVPSASLPAGVVEVNCGSQSADLTSVGAVQLIIDPDAQVDALDLELGFFETALLRDCTGKIGDTVWFDENRDGIQDPGEAGIENVTVRLADDQGNVLATSVTDADGYYEFVGLCADDYIVEVDTTSLPEGYVESPILEGEDVVKDSNANGSVVTLDADSTEDMTIDFGYNSPCAGKIGNYIWFDENRDGIQNAGEVGIENITVNLMDAQGTVLATVTTDADGYYEFVGLCLGNYLVEVDTSTLPADYVASPTLEGGDTTKDSNNNASEVTLDSDTAEDMTHDFGYNSPCAGQIGNYVWFDENRNGVQDAGEAGIENVTVNLTDAQGIVLATVTTDGNGYYEFAGVCAGDYQIEVDTSTVPVDYVISPTLEGADLTIDSNNNGSTVTLTTDNSVDETIDFGYNSPCTGKIGNYIWFDENRNGLQDAGETGISGVIVNLKDTQNTVIATASTDANGYYEFSGLCADDYKVEVDTSTVPADYVASPTLEGTDPTIDSNNNGSTVTLTTDNGVDKTIDFAYNSPCSGAIGNYIWFDENRNGIQDDNESGIVGITVNLKDDQGTVLATVITDASGFYEFAGLCADNYVVSVDTSTLPAEYVTSPTEEGVDVTADSNVNEFPVSLTTDVSVDTTVDFAYNSPCTGNIGNYVWLDLNQDGIQDFNESGIAGVTLNLKDEQNTVIATTVTNEFGFYEFLGFCAGNYIVEVNPATLPAGMVPTTSEVGFNGEIDSNSNPANVTLSGDFDSDITIDFGYFENLTPGVDGNCQVCDGKVTALTLQYTGTEAARIVVSQKKGGDVFNAMVQPGEEFSFSGTEKFGTLGTVINISVDGVQTTSMHTSCSVEIGPGYVDGDFEVTEAYSRNGGLMCPVEPSTPVTPNEPINDDCQVCDGKVTQLTLQYNGTEAAMIAVSQKKGGEVTNILVQPGGHFTFSGTEKHNTLGTEISVYVGGRLNTKMHTSCSVEIGPGYVSGDFEVIEAYSRNGGKMCAI